MTRRIVDQSGETINNTLTELQVLQSIEKAFYQNNPSSKRRNTQKSLKWFSKYVPRSYNKIRTSQLERDTNLFADSIVPGSMYFFHYDARHKATLPVWDKFPLIFPWDTWEKNGVKYFIGINLHYLPPALRLQAMQALLKLRNRKEYRRDVRLKISWQVLKAMAESRFFKHSVKMYRMDHVRSRFIKIPPVSWELSLFLPVARFVGKIEQAWEI